MSKELESENADNSFMFSTKDSFFGYAKAVCAVCALAVFFSACASNTQAICISPDAPPAPTNYPDDFDVNPSVRANEYREECFVRTEQALCYEGDERFTYRLGLDISRHDGRVNWRKVKKSGRDFVFLRIGWTGYQSGIIHTDERFFKNIRGAKKAGLDVGVYYFSQAITEEEARSEARHVIADLAGIALELPVAYDPESIPWEWARTDDITKEQVMKNTLAFFDEIKKAGYEPMIYSNLRWEAFFFDLEALGDSKIWYADYRETPKTPYHFEFLQYDGEAVEIKGVRRKCDGDIQLIPVKEQGEEKGVNNDSDFWDE